MPRLEGHKLLNHIAKVKLEVAVDGKNSIFPMKADPTRKAVT